MITTADVDRLHCGAQAGSEKALTGRRSKWSDEDREFAGFAAKALLVTVVSWAALFYVTLTLLGW